MYRMNLSYSLFFCLARVKVAILKKDEVVNNLRRQHEVRRLIVFAVGLRRERRVFWGDD